MNYINKVSIENFRSIKKGFFDCNNVNVFSGLNDSGKSNVLKALNLFFNSRTDYQTPLRFDRDYNKVALAEAQRANKKKQQIKVRIYLNLPDGSPSLKSESEIWIEKVFDRFNNVVTNYSTTDPKKVAVISRIFNKIKYFYVPALKGNDVLRGFLSELGEFNLIQESDIEGLNNSINSKVEGLNIISENSNLSLDSSFRLPVFLKDFWQSLSVQTTYDNFKQIDDQITGKGSNQSLNKEVYQIPLEIRGEGIKSKFIPVLLKWLQSLSKNIFIWGIDEPENSLEFRKAQELADLFFENYSRETQIFVTSHSLAFIFPTKSTKYNNIFRCTKDDFGLTNINLLAGLFEKESKISLADDMGILEIQKEVQEIYEKRTKELEILRQKIENLNATNKPIIYFEGETDKQFYELAYQNLKGKLPDKYEIFESDSLPSSRSSIGSGASKLNEFLFNHAIKISHSRKIIGVFDYDREGFEQLKGLTSKGLFTLEVDKDELKVARHNKNKNIIAILLPVPANRVGFTDRTNANYCYFSIELYFEDFEFHETNKSYPSKNDKSSFAFKGSKMEFVERIKNSNSFDLYKHFNILIDQIEILIQ